MNFLSRQFAVLSLITGLSWAADAQSYWTVYLDNQANKSEIATLLSTVRNTWYFQKPLRIALDTYEVILEKKSDSGWINVTNYLLADDTQERELSIHLRYIDHCTWVKYWFVCTINHSTTLYKKFLKSPLDKLQNSLTSFFSEPLIYWDMQLSRTVSWDSDTDLCYDFWDNELKEFFLQALRTVSQ